MLTALSALSAAVLAGVPIGTVTPGPGDDDVVVEQSQFGWIDTSVVDRQHLDGVKETARRSTRTTCSQTRSASAGGYASQEQFESGDAPSAGPGGWVTRVCTNGTLSMAWVPAPERGPVLAEQLAKSATGRLPLPLPEPHFNPSRPSAEGPSTLVAIPTWFWVDSWRPVQQATRAGDVWAEVLATPVAATWDPGDGSPVVRCAGPGTAWAPGAKDTRCEHTYVRSSAGQRGNVYAARVVVTWQVRWTGSGGRSGTLPLMERQMTFPIAVAERQTVVTMGGTE